MSVLFRWFQPSALHFDAWYYKTIGVEHTAHLACCLLYLLYRCTRPFTPQCSEAGLHSQVKLFPTEGHACKPQVLERHHSEVGSIIPQSLVALVIVEGAGNVGSILWQIVVR